MFKKNALISVYDKTDIDKFASGLVELGWRIYSSGGTAKFLREAGLEVIDIASLVGGGAILGHKVVTLSREVHAALLAYDIPEDVAELERLNIPWIDLVCVGLYPIEEAIQTKDPEAIRNMTDIGGPALLRSAAKGRRIVLAYMDQRTTVLENLKKFGDLTRIDRDKLAACAEQYVGGYCCVSAQHIFSA